VDCSNQGLESGLAQLGRSIVFPTVPVAQWMADDGEYQPMTALAVLAYLAAATFVTAVVVRSVRILRMPVHLRWELYPVAHEENAAYGGSFFERLEWWKHRSKPHRMGEVKVMVPEIFMLTGVRRHNPSLWLRSSPFHFGLYWLVGFCVLLVAGGMVEAIAAPADASAAATVLATLAGIAGLVGFILMGTGALALLLRRLGNPALRAHSSAADIFNLVFFFSTAVLGLSAFAFADSDFSLLRGFVRGLFTLQPAPELPALVVAEIILGCAVIAYIPLTHMSHFFTKWFMYHDVRWNDEVNRAGSRLEAAIDRQLGKKVSWSAPHIRGEGKKTWVDVATEEVGKP
jgi:nitrate reductase gamma subunit